jgi:small subunit ribosomal protein S16
MLVIRMQRTGRKGHAQFRVVVQDSRRTPTSGKIVASLGSYNPHTKTAQIDTAKAATYLQNGAQPSARVARLLKVEGVKLPKWVNEAGKKEGKLRNPEKLRRNQPKEEAVEATAEEPAEAPAAEVDEAVETPAEAPAATEEA